MCPGGRPAKDQVDRFWSHVNKNGPVPKHAPQLGRCWIWIGAKSRNGYGLFTKRNRVLIYAHRFLWEIEDGLEPTGKRILHKCDNPPCVRKLHTWPGTLKENIQDSISKGRFKIGERSASAKLSDADVFEIRRMYASGKFLQKELSKKFGITQMSVSVIVTRRGWKHLVDRDGYIPKKTRRRTR